MLTLPRDVSGATPFSKRLEGQGEGQQDLGRKTWVLSHEEVRRDRVYPLLPCREVSGDSKER